MTDKKRLGYLLITVFVIILTLWITPTALKEKSLALLIQSHANIAGTCSETDQGNNPLISGQTCTGEGCSQDRCESNKILKEYFCSNGQKTYENTTCDGTCYNEACHSKPNFIIFIADDMDWELTGFMGSNIAQTPNIDAIADKANIFKNAQSTMSVCRPPLASLASGKFPNENYIFHNYTPIATPNQSLLVEDSIIDDLRDSGYDTYHGGKWWEMPGPSAYGFTHLGEGIPEFVRVSQQSAFDFLDYSATSNKPFLMWYAPSLPHAPHDAPPEMEAIFENTAIEVPAWVAPELHQEFIGLQKKFLANIYRFDFGIGEVLAKLEQTNQADNTIIIYLMDNGFSFGYLSKYSMMEKGLRSPLVVKIPNQLEQTKQFKQPASTVDVAKLLLDYAGIDSSQIDEGRTWANLYRLLDSQLSNFRDTLVQGIYSPNLLEKPPPPLAEYSVAHYAITARNDKYKYIYYTRDVETAPGLNMYAEEFIPRFVGNEDFYDLDIDPYEKNNLIGNSEYMDEVENLRALTLTYRENIPGQNNGNGNAEKQTTTCTLNQVYSDPNACICNSHPSLNELTNASSAKVARWTEYKDDATLCTPDHSPKYVCREINMDFRTREAYVPGEVQIRAKQGVTLEQLTQFVQSNGATIRKQSCNWKTHDKFNTLIVETPIGEEQEFVKNIESSDLAINAFRLNQNICIPQGPELLRK
mgnify:FL=1